MILVPNATIDYPVITPGIARRLNILSGEPFEPGPFQAGVELQGGGDLNGSAQTSHLAGKSGTNGTQGQLARQNQRNYCGVYTGLIGQEQDGTNLLWVSGPHWSGPSTVPPLSTTVLAPDGTLTAQAYIEDTTNVQHSCWDHFVASNNITMITTSAYVKPFYPAIGAKRYFGIYSTFSSGGICALFDVNAGKIIPGIFLSGPMTAAMASVFMTFSVNGWYKCTLSIDASSAGVTLSNNNAFGLNINGNPTTGLLYTGDGVSGMYVWRMKETSP